MLRMRPGLILLARAHIQTVTRCGVAKIYRKVFAAPCFVSRGQDGDPEVESKMLLACAVVRRRFSLRWKKGSGCAPSLLITSTTAVMRRQSRLMEARK